MQERECKSCGVTKPLAHFYAFAPGKHRHKCKTCSANKQRDYQKRYDAKKREKKELNATLVESALAGEVRALTIKTNALEAQVQSLLAFALLHGYNSTET